MQKRVKDFRTWLPDEGECCVCGQPTLKGFRFDDIGPSFMDDLCFWTVFRPGEIKAGLYVEVPGRERKWDRAETS